MPPPKSGLSLMIAMKPKAKPKGVMTDKVSGDDGDVTNEVSQADRMTDEPEAEDSAMEEQAEPADDGMSGEPCIKPPDGFQPPDDTSGDGTFNGTFRGHMKDGKLYLDSLNEIPYNKKDNSMKNPAQEPMQTQDDYPEGRDRAAFNKVFH